MAARLAGNLITLKSILCQSSNSIIPSFLNIQVRHAKRKGYRQKMELKKKKLKLEKVKKAADTEKKSFFRSKIKKIEKTIEQQKPDPPLDDVFISENFKPKKYSLLDAINFHKEYHHPTICNNLSAHIQVRLEFDMTGKKKTQIINSFRGIAAIPHPFYLGINRDVLVLCGPEEVDEALKAGAKTSGGKEIVKRIKEGAIQISTYDYVLCHINFLPELTPIRKILSLKMPRLKSGTLTPDIPNTVKRFVHGIEYQCIKPDALPTFGLVECNIGPIDMEAEHLENNFRAILKDINKHKPHQKEDFVTWISCKSPPSPENFAIDLSLYLEEKEKSKDDEEEEEYNEKEEINKLKIKLKEEEEKNLVV